MKENKEDTTMEYISLNNGVKMPILGYGVYQVTKTSSFFSHQDPNMVEWFVKMVEERKKNNDSSKEKKNW